MTKRSRDPLFRRPMSILQQPAALSYSNYALHTVREGGGGPPFAARHASNRTVQFIDTMILARTRSTTHPRLLVFWKMFINGAIVAMCGTLL